MVNGVDVTVAADVDERLLDVLRRELGLTGVKESCGAGDCGTCTVLIDGQPHLSCITLMGRVDGEIETVEGVAAESRAFREALANRMGFQCGFCTPGHVMTAVSYLRSHTEFDADDVGHVLAGNICRCTGYQPIVQAYADVLGGPP